MEETLTTGVTEPVVAEQEIQVDNNATSTETAVETPTTGETTATVESPAAEDIPNEKVETAFAKRLTKEREKIAAEVRKQAEQEFKEQYRDVFTMLDKEGEQYGLDGVSYAKAVLANQSKIQEQRYYEALNTQAERLGVDPRELDQIIQQHPVFSEAKTAKQQLAEINEQIAQQKSFEQESLNFIKAYPDINPATIPDEVWQIKADKGLPLVEAYRLHTSDSEITSLRAKIAEMEKAMQVQQKNVENAFTSPGSVTGTGTAQDDFITFETFEMNRKNPKWVKDNYKRIQESRQKW